MIVLTTFIKKKKKKKMDALSSQKLRDFTGLSETKIAVDKLVYTALTNGIGYVKACRILSEFSVKTCSQSAFDTRLNELYIQLLNAAVDSCKEALSNSNTDKIVSFDGM